MTHEVFVKCMAEALSEHAGGNSKAAAIELRALVSELRTVVKSVVNEWHVQQALQGLATVLEESDEHDECLGVWQELVRHTEQMSTYWRQAAESAQTEYLKWQRR
jgi:hypothetical protein